MLSKLHVHNYLCIYDMSLELSFNKRAPVGYQESPNLYFIDCKSKCFKNSRIVPIFGVYGSNGSGKSTVLRTINILKFIVEYGHVKGLFSPNRIVDNPLNKDDSLYSEISVEFFLNGTKFNYTIRFDESKIVFEKLDVNEECLFKISNSKLQFCFDTVESVALEFNNRCLNAISNYQIKTFLFEISSALPGLDPRLILANTYICDDLIFILSNNKNGYIKGIKSLADTFDNKTEEDNFKAAVSMILDYLRRLDIGIDNIKIVDSTVNQSLGNQEIGTVNMTVNDPIGPIYDLKTIHKTVNDKEVIFDIQYESAGTKIIIGLLGEILAAIRSGKTVFIDDIDMSLHSFLVREIVRIFKSKRINENEAQLIFTAHNPEILDIMNENELGIIIYQKSKGSRIARISDYSSIKKDHSLKDAYMNGELGGIPFPYV